MHIPDELLPVLEELYELAQVVYAEVQAFRPNLVIGLAHSGWAPILAAQACWTAGMQRGALATVADPFPLALRTNIGQEKHAVYRRLYPQAPPAYCCDECAHDLARGHLLAWLAGQEAWQKALKGQIDEVWNAGRPPERILVVDELKGGGRSWLYILGLLDLIYPHAETRFVSGGHDWTNAMTRAWLRVFAPRLADQTEAEIAAKESGSSRERYPHALYPVLKPLVTGSEDISEDSLDWRPLTLDAEAVHAVEEVLPAGEALAAASWAYEMIVDYARRRTSGALPRPLKEKDEPYNTIWRMALEPVDRILRQAWLPGGVSRRQAVVLGNLTPSAAARVFKRLEEEDAIIPRGFGGGTTYIPSPYEAPNAVYAKVGLDVYWAEPGKWLIGRYPICYHSSGPDLRQELVGLLESGVSLFIDLTFPGESDFLRPYDGILQEVAAARGCQMRVVRFPLPAGRAPGREQVSSILDYLEVAFAAGERIYMHSSDGTGRAFTILCCVLICGGMPPRQALLEADRRRVGTFLSACRAPATEAQRHFILHLR
jgi:hypothetical protein